jgi:hypothetical protein
MPLDLARSLTRRIFARKIAARSREGEFRMRTITRSALPVFVALAAACGPSPDRVGEPQTPPTEQTAIYETDQSTQPLTPAAGAETTTAPETAPETTTPAPAPLTLQHGEMSHQIQHVVLMRDPNKKQKDKLMFFEAHVTCDEVMAAKNKPLTSTILATDVKADAGSIQLAQPMKLTFYMDGKPMPINAKKEEVTLNLQEGASPMMMSGNLRISSKIKNDELSVDGPFEVMVCDGTQGQGSMMKEGGMHGGMHGSSGTMPSTPPPSGKK